MAMVIGLKRTTLTAWGSVFAPARKPRCHKRGDCLLALVLLVAFALIPASFSASAELSRPSEYELKAAFIYNFIKFTEWPPHELGKTGDSFVIGILGKDPFGPALDKVIEGATVHNKTLVVRRFARIDESLESRVLFISSSEEKNLAGILRLLEGKSVLTVSEIENFAQRGGIINLKQESNRLVFDINLEAAKRAGLTMSAQLLKLAKIVSGKL